MRKQKQDKVTLVNGKGYKNIELDYVLIRKAVLALRAVNHKLRQEIMDYLQETGKQTVTDLYIKFRLEQSVASQHLAILRRANIVNTERKGKHIYYFLNDDQIKKVAELTENLTE